ncbi:hypothetical protein ACO0QE_003246 [Hanseniaspora vineae]
MRRVLACKYCRLHKRKCVHEGGKPPCSYCVKMGLQDDCELSYPVVKSKLDVKMAAKENFDNEYAKMIYDSERSMAQAMQMQQSVSDYTPSLSNNAVINNNTAGSAYHSSNNNSQYHGQPAGMTNASNQYFPLNNSMNHQSNAQLHSQTHNQLSNQIRNQGQNPYPYPNEPPRYYSNAQGATATSGNLYNDNNTLHSVGTAKSASINSINDTCDMFNQRKSRSSSLTGSDDDGRSSSTQGAIQSLTKSHAYGANKPPLDLKQFLATIPTDVIILGIEIMTHFYNGKLLLDKKYILENYDSLEPLLIGTILAFVSNNHPLKIHNYWLGVNSSFVKNNTFLNLCMQDVLYGDYFETPNIQVIQALLIMSLLTLQGKLRSWLFLSTALSTIKYMFDFQDINLHSLEGEILKRTFWTSIVIKKVLFPDMNKQLVLDSEEKSYIYDMELPYTDENDNLVVFDENASTSGNKKMQNKLQNGYNQKFHINKENENGFDLDHSTESDNSYANHSNRFATDEPNKSKHRHNVSIEEFQNRIETGFLDKSDKTIGYGQKKKILTIDNIFNVDNQVNNTGKPPKNKIAYYLAFMDIYFECKRNFASQKEYEQRTNEIFTSLDIENGFCMESLYDQVIVSMNFRKKLGELFIFKSVLPCIPGNYSSDMDIDAEIRKPKPLNYSSWKHYYKTFGKFVLETSEFFNKLLCAHNPKYKEFAFFSENGLMKSTCDDSDNEELEEHQNLVFDDCLKNPMFDENKIKQIKEIYSKDFLLQGNYYFYAFHEISLIANYFVEFKLPYHEEISKTNIVKNAYTFLNSSIKSTDYFKKSCNLVGRKLDYFYKIINSDFQNLKSWNLDYKDHFIVTCASKPTVFGTAHSQLGSYLTEYQNVSKTKNHTLNSVFISLFTTDEMGVINDTNIFPLKK